MMQPYTTPAPGRTPGPNVIDNLNYKVNVRLTALRNETWHVEFDTWTPEHRWVHRELFLTAEELQRLQKALST
jgi:hypothetical protein